MDQIGMLWLTGMNSPDHTTLWRFWRDNQLAIRKIFKQLLQIAVSMNLVGMVLHAVDGTKLLSQASKYKAWHRATLEEKLKTLDKAIDEIMKETEQTSDEQTSECRLPEELQEKEKLRERIQDQLRQLEQQGRDHLNPGDEDARMTKCREGKKFAYNAQAVVDAQTQLFVAVDVVTDESDNYQLVPMLEKVEENLGRVGTHGRRCGLQGGDGIGSSGTEKVFRAGKPGRAGERTLSCLALHLRRAAGSVHLPARGIAAIRKYQSARQGRTL